jgi:SAM-dependent methyltransferase
MRDFWDERAAEDAFYFVDNRLTYGDPDTDEFWRDGERLVDEILGLLGLELRPGDELVEIGCGIGRLTRPLAARCRSVRALDVSPRMLELARAHNPELANVEWLLGDGSTLRPIADRSADACFSHVVFQHLPTPALALAYVREMGRVLRPGGWAGFQLSNAPEIHRRPPAARRARAWLAAARGRGPRGLAHAAWRGSAVDLAEVERAAAGAGLELERTVGGGTQFCFVRLRAQPAAAA